MKKFYETPAVEFTGFDVEDIITTSGDEPVVPENINSADPVNDGLVSAAVSTLDAGANTGAAKYGTYAW